MLMLPTLAKQIEKKIKETKENIYKNLTLAARTIIASPEVVPHYGVCKGALRR
jgi:hypothetical protein